MIKGYDREQILK